MLLVGPIIITVRGVFGNDSLKVPTFPVILIVSPSLYDDLSVETVIGGIEVDDSILAASPIFQYNLH